MKNLFVIILLNGLISFFLVTNQVPVLAQNSNLDLVNQKVCDRFNDDSLRLAAIMDEYKRRKGITQTRVAYGNVNTPVENADYYINYAAEAIAYQRVQHFSSAAGLRSALQVLVGKISKAKAEVGGVLGES